VLVSLFLFYKKEEGKKKNREMTDLCVSRFCANEGDYWKKKEERELSVQTFVGSWLHICSVLDRRSLWAHFEWERPQLLGSQKS
jgi:hypothetical protein